MRPTTKIDTLNPLVGRLAAEYRVWALNYDLLVAFDRTTMEPDTKHSLATFTRSRDQLKWTYHLKPGLRWSDGAPLTARDVVFTMNFLRRRRAPTSIAAVKSWKALDATTVVAKLKHRSVEMSSLWIYILPEHVWKAADTDNWRSFKVPLPLVGSGPYTVTRWNPNGTTELRRNPYFRRAKSVTGPTRVLMTYYGDRNGAVAALEQNRLDALPSDTLDVQSARRLQRASGVRVYRSPPVGLEYWVFNLSSSPTARVHSKVVKSRAIRTALAWAIDRSKLVTASLFGYGTPGNTQLPRSYGRFTLDLSDDPVLGYHYDPERARRILEQGGWHLGPGGIRRKDGVPAEFELAYDGSDTTEKRAVALIKAWARDVGIKIDVRVYDAAKLIDLEFNKDDEDRLRPDFDTEIWSIGGDPTPEFLLSLFTKAQIGVWNDSGFTTPRYEQLYKAELSASSRPRARRTSTRSSASRRRNCPTSSSTRPTTSARSTRARGRTGRRSPRPAASRSPSTATRRSSRCAPASARAPAIRAWRGHSAASGCWRCSPRPRRSSRARRERARAARAARRRAGESGEVPADPLVAREDRVRVRARWRSSWRPTSSSSGRSATRGTT